MFTKHLNTIANTSGSNAKISLVAEFINADKVMAFKILSVLKNPKISTYITRKTIDKFDDKTKQKPTEHATVRDFYLHYLDLFIGNGRLTQNELIGCLAELNSIANEEESEIFKQILCKKSDINIGLSAWNKAVKLAGAAFSDIAIEDYRCAKVSNLDKAVINYEDCYTSCKLDGVNASFDGGGDAHFLSRLGNPIPMHHLEGVISPIKNIFVIFGELTNGEGKTRQSASGLVNSAIKQGYDGKKEVGNLIFNVFDCMTVEEYRSKKFKTPFIERKELAKEAVALIDSPLVKLVEHTHCTSLESVIERNAAFVADGEEGIIINDAMSIFALKKMTSRGRIKEVFSADLEIVAFTKHKKYPEKMIGAMVCKTRCGNLQINVGTGFSDKLREELYQNPDNYIGGLAAINYNKVIDVAENVTTHSKTLFLSVFDRFRNDKLIADNLDDIEHGS